MPTENDAISKNKIAIVTGGSRGIGRNIVLSLAKRGVNSIFTYNSNQTEAEKVVGLVAETGRKAIASQLDTGNIGAFDTFGQSVRSALKSLGATHFDYLVNIGPMIASLLSEENRWINAERIEVSGGYV
jgi:NAD(P)-dependent dehydrogenase (short-subunit alcohol dehydrogenase family)